VQGYVIEGHVPADLIHRLLKEKPAVAGLAVPGMGWKEPIRSRMKSSLLTRTERLRYMRGDENLV
jgi:hypothetical protein